MPLRRIIVLIAAFTIVILGLITPIRVAVSDGYFEKARAPQSDAVDEFIERYKLIRPLVHQESAIGYVTDSIIHGNRTASAHYIFTQYAVAPVVVDSEPVHRIVFANFDRAELLPRFCERFGYRVVHQFAAGKAIIEKDTP